MVGNTTTVVISKLLVFPVYCTDLKKLESYFNTYYIVGKSALFTSRGIFWPMGYDFHRIKDNFPNTYTYSMILGVYNERKILLEMMKEPQVFGGCITKEIGKELTFNIDECRIF